MDKVPRKNVEVLYFEGCPNHRQTVELARDVVAELGVDAVVEELEVKTLEDAVRLRFLGSPSVQVDGVDIEPAARASTAYAFACRTYNGAGVPPRRLFVEALGGAPGIHSMPAVVIDGALADCCARRGPDEPTLRAAGLGQ